MPSFSITRGNPKPIANSWVRVRSGGSRKKLAFAVDETMFLVASPHCRTLQLRPDQVDVLIPPDDEVLFAEGNPPWWGLLQRAHIDEFDAFARSFHPVLLKATHLHDTPVVVAGDRVVAVAGRETGHSGIIYHVIQYQRRGQVKLQDRHAQVIPIRFTADYLSNRGESKALEEEEPRHSSALTDTELALRMPKTNDDQRYRLVPFPHLRHHALDFAHLLHVNDGVRCFSADKLTYIDAVLLDHVVLRTGTRARFDNVFRVWWVGDLVRVRWREHKDQVGYVVDVIEDGLLQIFDLNDTPPSSEGAWSEQNKFFVPANDVDLYIPGSIQRLTHAPTATALPLHQPHPIAPSLSLELGDRDNKTALSGRARCLVGVEVQVIKKHVWKSMRGMIVGDMDSPARAIHLEEAFCLADLTKMRAGVARDEKRALVLSEQWRSEVEFKRELGTHDGIVLTIRKEATNLKMEDIRIEDVVHIGTNLPLHLKPSAFPKIFAWRTGPPHPDASAPSKHSACLTCGERRVDREEDGQWMCIPELCMKRIDVRIVRVARFPQASATTVKFEGLSGYLLLQRPPAPSELMVIVYGVGPTARRPRIHRHCVVPLREDRNGNKLSEFLERVIVLRPNVHGDNRHRGQYAQTIPFFQHAHGPAVVIV
ncbi:hypothetical protein R3P38DRAFT_3178692 [Favolaschia claudopus]|uniref:Uncharacterized protein n=1 Tax=Favolaschia claudopus TaxID=2862362 RepID=A0AAW0CSQ6_9AGAR